MCIIDFDTTMQGTPLYDFGDLCRSHPFFLFYNPKPRMMRMTAVQDSGAGLRGR